MKRFFLASKCAPMRARGQDGPWIGRVSGAKNGKTAPPFVFVERFGNHDACMRWAMMTWTRRHNQSYLLECRRCIR